MRIENKNRVFIVSFISYIILYFLLVFKFLPSYSTLISGIFILIMTFLSLALYKFRSFEYNKTNKRIILLVFIGMIIFFTIVYSLGFLTGYGRDVYSNSISSILKNSLIPLVSVISLEFFRYIFVSNNKEEKNIVYLMTFLIILFDLILNIYSFDINLLNIFKYLTITFIPIVIKNITLTYITKNTGYVPCLIYVIPLCLYNYICYIKPDLGNYLKSVLNIILPALLFIYSSRIYGNVDNKKKKSLLRVLIDIPFILFFTILIGLISGYFKYHLIGVEKSAINNIEKGDAILINRTIKYNNYNEDDIVAYKQNNKIVIYKINKKEVDNLGIVKLYVVDEINDDKENYMVLDKDNLMGRYVKIKIGKIAYPTIWFKELIGGDLNE